MIEKVNWNGKELILNWLSADEFFKTQSKNVTSCFLIAKYPSAPTSILMTKNPRGLDFIGGHLEDNETPFETVKREAMEEAGIDLHKSRLLGAIHVFDNEWTKESKYPESAYQLFYLSDTFDGFNLLSFKGEHECSERLWVDLSDIEKEHHNLLKVHKEMLKSI